MGSFSIWHWLVVLAVVVLLFGTKKLRNAGGDIGAAIRSFRKGLNEDEAAKIESGAKGEPAGASTSADEQRERSEQR